MWRRIKKHWHLRWHLKWSSEFSLVNPMYFSLVRSIPKYRIALHCFIDLPWRCHNKDTPIRPGPNRSNKVFRRDCDFQNLTSLQIHRVSFGSVVRWARWCKGAVCAPQVPPLRDSGKRYISRGSTIPANKICPRYRNKKVWDWSSDAQFLCKLLHLTTAAITSLHLSVIYDSHK